MDCTALQSSFVLVTDSFFIAVDKCTDLINLRFKVHGIPKILFSFEPSLFPFFFPSFSINLSKLFLGKYQKKSMLLYELLQWNLRSSNKQQKLKFMLVFMTIICKKLVFHQASCLSANQLRLCSYKPILMYFVNIEKELAQANLVKANSPHTPSRAKPKIEVSRIEAYYGLLT